MLWPTAWVQVLHCPSTLLETNMETPKGPYKDYSPSKMGAIWVSMLVWESVRCRLRLVFQNDSMEFLSMTAEGWQATRFRV